MKEEDIKKAQEAGRKAVEGRRKGFHCSESVFTAINDVLKITDPSLVRMVTGFHGGGIGRMGSACGALIGGAMALSLLYGRTYEDMQAILA